MTLARLTKTIVAAAVFCSLSACGGAKLSETCDEPKAYQAVVPGKKIVVPEGLDPLEEFKEMPIPKAESAPRPEGARCLEKAPSVLSGSTSG